MKQTPSQPIAAVMVHVSNVEAALAWYSRAFTSATRCQTAMGPLQCLTLGGVQLELVPSDEKVSSGPSGSVVYWHVADFDAELPRLQAIGATLYRGPMQIECGLSMCQVQDPWGNCIGIRGPSRSVKSSH